MRYIRTLNGIFGCSFTVSASHKWPLKFEGKANRDLILSVYKTKPMMPGKEDCTLKHDFLDFSGKSNFSAERAETF